MGLNPGSGEAGMIDRLAVALEIEDKQRQLDELLDEQRNLIAETLLLCQAYIDLQAEYER